jgi:peptide/bleomycin uptake transporter
VFHSFFPQPKLFFSSMVVWTLLAILGWYFFAAGFGAAHGFAPVPQEQQPYDLSFFLLPENLWFYGYFILMTVLFCGFWHFKALQPSMEIVVRLGFGADCFYHLFWRAAHGCRKQLAWAFL